MEKIKDSLMIVSNKDHKVKLRFSIFLIQLIIY